MNQQGCNNDFKDTVYERIIQVQEKRPDLIPLDVDVEEKYGMNRSCRRGSITHTRNMEVSEPDINVQMYWVGKDKQGRKLTQKMCDNYTDFRAALPTLLRFSQAL